MRRCGKRESESEGEHPQAVAVEGDQQLAAEALGLFAGPAEGEDRAGDLAPAGGGFEVARIAMPSRVNLKNSANATINSIAVQKVQM